MKPNRLTACCLACAILAGQMLGHGDGQIPQHVPDERSPIVQVDGPGEYGERAEASNTQAGSYDGDGIVRSCSIPCSADIAG